MPPNPLVPLHFALCPLVTLWSNLLNACPLTPWFHLSFLYTPTLLPHHPLNLSSHHSLIYSLNTFVPLHNLCHIAPWSIITSCMPPNPLAVALGVCELDDEMDDILLPPLEQLQHSLDGLERLVQQTDGTTVNTPRGGRPYYYACIFNPPILLCLLLYDFVMSFIT